MIQVDRMQAGLVSWLRQENPGETVLWSPSEYPRKSSSPVTFVVRMLTGFDISTLGGWHRETAALPTRARVKINDSTKSGMVKISDMRYTFGANLDVTTARDELLAALQGTPQLVRATYAAINTDEIEVTAELGDLWCLSSSPGVEIAIEESTACDIQTGDIDGTIEIQAHGARCDPNGEAHPRYPRGGATAVLSRLLARSHLVHNIQLLCQYGIAIRGPSGSILNLDALAGPTWESRAAVRLELGIRTLQAHPAKLATRVCENYVWSNR